MSMSFEDFDTAPVFAISVVAQLTGMHPQTLRQYDRVGLVTPQRTSGGGRRYSARDVERLREIQQLSGEGIGLTGVKRILDLEHLADQLTARVRRARGRPRHSAPRAHPAAAERNARDRRRAARQRCGGRLARAAPLIAVDTSSPGAPMDFTTRSREALASCPAICGLRRQPAARAGPPARCAGERG